MAAVRFITENGGHIEVDGVLYPLATQTWANTQTAALTKASVGLGLVDNTADSAKPVSTVQQTALNLKANLTSPTLVTPVLGVATGTSLAVTGTLTSSSATAGIGYAAGAGGAVTQLTNKATATPAINKMCGTVTMNAAALAADTSVAHVLSNSSIAATDMVVINQTSGGTLGAYTFAVAPAAGSATVTVRNVTPGSLSEALVYRFAVIKATVS